MVIAVVVVNTHEPAGDFRPHDGIRDRAVDHVAQHAVTVLLQRPFCQHEESIGLFLRGAFQVPIHGV